MVIYCATISDPRLVPLTFSNVKGKNTVTLYFKQAKWFTALLVISLVGLSILAIYGLYYFCTHIKKYFQGIAAGQIN